MRTALVEVLIDIYDPIELVDRFFENWYMC